MADTICIVDDDVKNINSAGYILSREGFDVMGFKSGRAFLKNIDKGNIPALVLLDVKMPEMDGFETLIEIKKTKAADVPVIFLTGDEREESRKKGLELGAVDFIEKPFVPDVLIERVRTVTGRVKE